MTIESGVNDGVVHAGNASATNFAFPFKVNLSSQVEVIYRAADGSEVTLTENTHYTVNNHSVEGSGSIDYPKAGSPSPYNVALPVGAKLAINPKMDYKQQTDIRNQGRFAPQIHEDAFDTLMMHIKELRGVSNRAILFKKSSEITGAEFGDDPEDGYGLLWDGTTGTIRNTATSFANLETYGATINTNIADIITVADDLNGSDTIGTVAADLTGDNDIGTVAAAIANVNTVASAIADVSTVATDIADVSTVASAIIAVNTVATYYGNVNIVANDIASVNTVAANISDVNDVVTNLAAIIDAPNQAAAAAAAYDSFDDRYLGAKSSDPSTDNDGDALSVGVIYYNSTTGFFRVYNGSGWENGIDASSFLYTNDPSSSGSDNEVFGSTAGESLTSGFQNTLFGVNAGGDITSGTRNTAFGYQALADASTATGNTAFGWRALYDLDTGNYNTMVGEQAAEIKGQISESTGVGYRVFDRGGVTVGDTCIGYQAGTGLQTSSYNVIIGHSNCNTVTTNDSRNIIIGYDLEFPSSGTTDWLNIGNLITGRVHSASTRAMFVAGSISSTIADANFGADGNRAFMDFATDTARFGSANGGGSATETEIWSNNAVAISIDSSQVVSIPSLEHYRFGSYQIFTSSGTWTRPSGCRAVIAEVVGGGGGGGGSQAGNCGAGGGAGGYGRHFTTSAGSSETITIGAGGTGGASGGNDGTSGGNTSFGSHCTAAGGSGGYNGTNGTPGTGGGVTVGSNLVSLQGEHGGKGDLTTGSIPGGKGGDSYHGAGGNASLGGGGAGFKGGGGGGGTNSAAGGNGGSGIVVVYEFY